VFLGLRPLEFGFTGTLFPYSLHHNARASIVGPRARAFAVISYSTRGGTCAKTVRDVIGLQGYAPYNMAKEAVRALTRSAAREWGADKITVNNVMPVADTWGTAANVPTRTNVLGRYGSPEEDIAPVVLFLASKDAQFLTGYSLTPDGGQIIDSAR